MSGWSALLGVPFMTLSYCFGRFTHSALWLTNIKQPYFPPLKRMVVFLGPYGGVSMFVRGRAWELRFQVVDRRKFLPEPYPEVYEIQ